MSAGISALGWAAIIGATASTAYSSDQQRKGVHAQQDALLKAQEDDARQRAETETAAQVSAGANMADAKRRRRASALGLGAPADATAASAAPGGSVLSQGRATIQPQQKTTLLGGGGGI